MPQPNDRQKIPLGRQKPVSTSRRKRRIRKIMPYRFASTGLITGYLHFSRDIRNNVECSFILLADMTMIFFFKMKAMIVWSCGGLNSGLFACKANTLPLSYNPLTIETTSMFLILAFYLSIICTTLEFRRIELWSFHMRNEHSTSELQLLNLCSFALSDC